MVGEASAITPEEVGRPVSTQVRRNSSTLVRRAAKGDECCPIWPLDRLDALCPELDVVVLALPLAEGTRRLFDRARLARLKSDCLFVNVGRGGTVDTEALIAALEEGEIAGAGLDVTDPEPLPTDHPLWTAPNLIITPHYAAWSDIGRERRWLLYRENLRRFVAGEPLLSVVDPERGY